jgi:hypothetical protein
MTPMSRSLGRPSDFVAAGEQTADKSSSLVGLTCRNEIGQLT